MAERVDPANLVGTAEIARRLGVKQHRVVNEWLRRYPDFPKPLAIVSGVRVWDWPDIERWARQTGRPVDSPDLSTGDVAWSDRETRAMFRRSMRSVWVLLGLVVLAIVIFAVKSTVDSHDVHQLERHGVHTTGVVIRMEKFVCDGKGASMGVEGSFASRSTAESRTTRSTPPAVQDCSSERWSRSSTTRTTHRPSR